MDPRQDMYLAVWGSASGRAAGVLSPVPESREAAAARASEWLARQDNPAVGAWIAPADGDDMDA